MSWFCEKSQIMVVSHGFLKYQFLKILNFSPKVQIDRRRQFQTRASGLNCQRVPHMRTDRHDMRHKESPVFRVKKKTAGKAAKKPLRILLARVADSNGFPSLYKTHFGAGFRRIACCQRILRPRRNCPMIAALRGPPIVSGTSNRTTVRDNSDELLTSVSFVRASFGELI